MPGFFRPHRPRKAFRSRWHRRFRFLPFSAGAVQNIATVLVTLILSYFSLVLGELVPKKIAMQRAEQLSLKAVDVLRFVATVFKPFIWFLSLSTNFVIKLLGFDPNAGEETVTEEEILMMVDAGEENGVFEETTKDMISNIFDFDDRTVSELMTHRTEMTAVEDTGSVSDVVRMALEDGHSRIPVYHEDFDDIRGILYVKDLLRYVGNQNAETVALTDIMRPAYFVPESKKCSELFTELTAKRLQMAVVCDEYGGTSGIITMEDLLEGIVGNMQDEYDNEEEEMSQLSENSFTVDGATALDEVSDLIGVSLPEGDYDTIAGFLMERLGRIPQPGEHPVVTFENVTFTVEEVEDRRISEILIEKTPLPPNPDDVESEDKKGTGKQEKRLNLGRSACRTAFFCKMRPGFLEEGCKIV